ncbi:MAG: hypothetical protein ACPG45_09365 [Flavobacteriaceae bacterium]
MRKISAPETAKLYAFTKAHYVEYYDLQTELVDHLANGIELLWQEKPTLSFDDALQVEFKKFGVFGFTDLVSERLKKMNKRYNKLILSILKTYFTIPKLFLTTMMVLLMYVFLNTVPYKEYVVIGVFVILLIVMLYKTVVYKIKQGKLKKREQKLWMFEEVIYSYGQSFTLFQILVFFPPHFLSPKFLVKIMNYTVGMMVLSVVLTLFLIGVYVIIKIIPSKAREYISNAHPEYHLV